MTTPAPCPAHLLGLQALVDGELDTLATIALEQHLRGCAGCRAHLDRIEATRALFADHPLRLEAPAHLRQRVERIATMPAGRPLHRRHSATGQKAAMWLGGGLFGALAASIALFLAVPEIGEPGLVDAVVDGQIRSLQGNHLVDVQTSDRHTVKPWFNGRISFAPPVVDLKAQGFPLVGGRLDVVARENVAVLVFHRRLHTINLFIRLAPRFASPFPAQQVRAGYNVLRWNGGGLEFWAVSDLNIAELNEFKHSFIRQSATS